MGIRTLKCRIPCLLIALLAAIGFYAFALPRSPGADRLTFVGYVLFQVPNFVVFICKGLQSLGVLEVDSAILLVCWPVIFVMNYAFLQWWHRWIAARQMAKFDLVAAESNPNDVFPTGASFILAVQHAFYHAHSYVLTWQPLAWAIQRWPHNSSIWILFVRYLLIYPEAQLMLARVYDQFTESGCCYLTRESFLFCARSYLYSRDEHESKWLLRKFRRLSARIERVKRNLISFWSSVINNTSTLTFKLSRVIADRFNAIDAEFWHLSVQFPRNSFVWARYSAFASGVLNDPKAAAAWRARADVLREQRSEAMDVLSMNAFAVFPLIPRSLPTPAPGRTFDEATTDSKTASSATAEPEDHGDDSQEDDKDDVAQSRIRELAATTVIVPVRRLTWIALVYFATIVLLGAVLPVWLAFSSGEWINENLLAVDAVCEIGSTMDRTVSIMLKDALAAAHGFPTGAEEATELGDDTGNPRPFGEQVNDSATRLDRVIHQFEKMVAMYSDVIDQNSLWYTVIDSDFHTFTQRQYKSTVTSAMSMIAQNFFVYVVPPSTPLNSRIWLLNGVVNAKNVTEGVFNVAHDLAEGVLRQCISHDKVHLAVYLVLVVVAALFIPLFVDAIYRIHTAWQTTLAGLSSLSRGAVEAVVSKFGATDSAEVDGEHRLFINMQSSCDARRGAQLSAQIPLLMANVLAPVLLGLMPYIVHLDTSSDFRWIPYRTY
jgi:hypothetical protein